MANWIEKKSEIIYGNKAKSERMDINKDIDLFIADTMEKQLKIKSDFQNLFLHVFQKSLDGIQWEHFYLNCPYGQTVSFVYYHKNIMIAHGGLIPQKLLSREGREYDYYLQTAIMIEEEHRNLHIFKKLMDEIHQYVVERNAFDLAFPNDKSYLPFIKLLEWQNVMEYNIYQYVLTDDCASLDQYYKDTERDFTYSLNLDDEFLKWRGELNHLKVFEEEGCKVVYKDYEGALELLDVSVRKRGIRVSVSEITDSLGYSKVNIPECFFNMLDLKGLSLLGTVGIPQRMCLFPSSIDRVEYKEIKPSLLLSDVF